VVQASNGRQLRAMARTVDGERGKDNGFLTAVRELDRERRAVRAVAAFARHLAGTDTLPPTAPQVLLGDAAAEVPPPAPVVPSRPAVRVWTKDIRPGPHDVLTWEEAMTVPWIDGSEEAEG